MAALFPFPELMITKGILEYAAEIDTPTCLAVCLTCKDLFGRSVTGRQNGGLDTGRRALYRDVKIPRPDDGEGDGRRKHLDKWISLCRALLSNRDLAKYVRSLDVHFDDEDHAKLAFLPPAFGDEKDLRDLVDNELSLTPIQKQILFGWLEATTSRGNIEHTPSVLKWGCIGIVMIASPKLTSLRGSGSLQDLGIVGSLSEGLQSSSRPNEVYPVPSAHRLFSLQEVTFTEDSNDFSNPPGTIVPSLIHDLLDWWPDLRRLTIEGLSQDWNDEYLTDELYDSSLEELHIRLAIGQVDDGFYRLLDRCPHLKRFTLILDDQSDLWTTIDWRRLRETLLNSNTKLEELRIDIPPRSFLPQLFSATGSHFWGESLSLGQLRHLRKLALPRLILAGGSDHPSQIHVLRTVAGQLLPASLEELEVFCDGADLTVGDKAFPHLPGIEHVKDITVLNCMRDRWISRRRIEERGWVEISLGLRREDDPERLIPRVGRELLNITPLSPSLIQ